jgi:hypothetical protein
VSRRPLVLSAVSAAAIVALIPVGRWERQHRADEEMRGMERVLAAVGPLDAPSLKGFRVLANFDCLVYRRGKNLYALEVCVDDQGRVVEAIDRRTGDPKISSLRDDRTSSEIRVDRREVDRLLVLMGVPARLLPTTS